MHTFVFQQGQIRAVNRRPQSQGGGFGDAATPLAISADGSQVLVLSRYPETLLERYQANPAEGAAQLLLLNTRGANSRLVSRSATSAENGADQEVHFVAASKSMRYVLFSSAAQNLEGAQPGANEDAYFLADTKTGSVLRLGRVGPSRSSSNTDYDLPAGFFSDDER